MNTQTDKRRPYIRSMDRWWKRDPYFIRYLAMEATSILVAIYALILLVGVFRLSQGEAAYNGWLDALKSPTSVGFHILILLVFMYHSWSWFKIMPKTLPNFYLGGTKVPQTVITWTGVAVSVVLNLLILFILSGVKL
jgi:fumarate reductase subunit C